MKTRVSIIEMDDLKIINNYMKFSKKINLKGYQPIFQ